MMTVKIVKPKGGDYVKDADRYTMQAGEVALRLHVSRETVHNLAETGVLSYVEKARGRTHWKYFNPEEVEAYAQQRGVQQA